MIDYTIDWMPENGAELEANMNEAFEKIVEERERGISGYYFLPQDSRMIVEEVEATLLPTQTVQEADTVVVIGIGGSSLGAKALDGVLRSITPEAKRMVFLENPDPVEVSEKLESIDPDKSLFCIISKSGGTIETTTLYKIVLDRFGLRPESEHKERLFVITDEGSILHRYAEEHGIKSYFIPHNVGGRFSVLSAVGMVPLTLAGYKTCDILKGAQQIVKAFFDRQADHILQKGVFYAGHWQDYPMNVLFAYGSFLEDFAKWYVQLWGESLGKIDAQGERVGLTPLGHIGSVDQHSFLQLIMEGPRDKTVTFLKVEHFPTEITIPDISLKHIEKNDYINGHSLGELLDGECEATWESIRSQGVPTDGIVLDRISEENLGELILYYELLTSVAGATLGIDTYNQPGVELGKKILVKKFH
ncbi:glucose-6-phosphate isomerase [Nitratifractor salsuginis]|uniref:Glucose-6-phosphate isomerase n=1 Tax=Nitratifractor salsuginis (strain DSM 16511 / JCM 12458 / E9I37-1) TaxID=749222 RepID=E6X3I8_NITSE|nr:glucose-6-phosphate isomerase [Nitratifractor salsuginis]ADV46265.1 glucose-6-phosphate isomerase [Nitratifractor salsuginis DSM 16511]